MDEEKKQEYEEPSLVDLEDVAGGLVDRAGVCATSGSAQNCGGCSTSGSTFADADPIEKQPIG